jgi:hypothetical protein
MKLPLLEAAQAQKHVTMNEATVLVDALTNLLLLDRDLASPPGGVVDGDAYLVAAGASGSWAGREGEIALRVDGAWRFAPPFAGLRVFVADEAVSLVHDGSGFVSQQSETLAIGASGSAIRASVLEEEVALSGASVASTITIADRRIVLGVSLRVTEAVTGATSFSCGVAGEADKFGDLLGTALGASNVGVIGATAFYADTPVLLTANGGAFTGGKVRIAIHALAFTAPAS